MRQLQPCEQDGWGQTGCCGWMRRCGQAVFLYARSCVHACVRRSAICTGAHQLNMCVCTAAAAWVV